MRPVTVSHKSHPIPGLPQRDRPPAGKRPPHTTIAAVVPVAPAAEKIVEAVVLLKDDDDVSEWTHRPRNGMVRPSRSSRGQQLREHRNQHWNPDPSHRSRKTGAQIRRRV